MNNYWIEKAVKANQKLLKMKALTLTFLKTKENLIMMMLPFQESRESFSSMKRHQTNKAEILLGPKKGDHLEWTNKKLSPENNPRNAGRQSAVYISSTGGPTSYTKSNSKKNKKQKKLQANS